MSVGQLHTVAGVEELPVGGTTVVEVGDREIAVFHCEAGFFATQSECLHMQGPVGHGKLDGCMVTCPWHGWQYDVRTGENVFDRALALETYEVVVEDGEVKVAV